MIGCRRFSVWNDNIRYDIELRRNVTIINGDSGTGKTNLYDMVRKLSENSRDGYDRDIGISSNATESLMAMTNSLSSVNEVEMACGKIVFVDENNEFLDTNLFADIVNKGKNYFVIITRKNLCRIAYSMHEIYEIVCIKNRKSGGMTLNRLYRRFNDIKNKHSDYDLAVTEDSNSGFDAICLIVGKENTVSAFGNSNVFEVLKRDFVEGKRIIAIVDGAAFGAYVHEVNKFCDMKGICLFAPESFEYLVLSSDNISRYLSDELTDTYKYCDSEKFATWERYFTWLLTDTCKNRIPFKFEYTKKKLPMELRKEWFIDFIAGCIYK